MGFLKFALPFIIVFPLIINAQEADEDLVREISGPKSIKTVYLVSAKKDDIRDELLIVFSDISKSKNLEKMREDFIGNVSHELRTPISVIKANAETLINNKLIKDDENAKFFTEAISSQSERMKGNFHLDQRLEHHLLKQEHLLA